MISFQSLTAWLVFIFISTASFAQSDSKYREEADNLRKDIWNWKRPEFQQRSIPDEYAGASKVVIARRLEVNADSKKKLAFRFGLAAYRELMLTEILREAVKVNDNSAISEYSEIS